MLRNRSIRSMLRSCWMACWDWFQRPNTTRAAPVATTTAPLVTASRSPGLARWLGSGFMTSVGSTACRGACLGLSQNSTSMGFSGSNTRLSTCSARSSQ